MADQTPMPEEIYSPQDLRYLLAVRIAVIAAVFMAVVLGLLLANLVRARMTDPTQTARIEQMRIDLLKDANNQELVDQIRLLDVHIREGYYRSRRFALQGVFMLLGGVIIFLIALHTAATSRPSPAAPRPEAGSRALLATVVARRSVVVLGVVLAGILVTLAVLSRHDSTAEYVRAADDAEKKRAHEELMAALRGDPGVQGPMGLAGASGAAGAPGSSGARGYTGQAGATGPQGAQGAQGPAGPAGPPGPAGGSGASRGDVEYPAPEQFAVNWPRFRGYQGLGHAEGDEYPVKWNGTTGDGVLWSAEVPLPGESSPIVWGDRVFCTGADEQTREVYCFDAATGKLLWTRKVENEISAEDEPPEPTEDTGYAAPTMATDGSRVFAIFANGDLAAFDFEGQQLWTRSMGPPDNYYGHASSLTTWPGMVIVQLDQGSDPEAEESALVAIDATTGKRVWETPRPVPNSWSSPIIIEHEGRPQVITTANPWVISYNPDTGEEYWRANCLQGDVGPSPTYCNGLVIAAQDGADLVGIRPYGEGDVTDTHIAWKTAGNLPEAVSPLCDGHYIYVLTGWGMLTCFDMGGKQLWEHDMGASFYGSPTLAADRIYIVDREGLMHIFKGGSTFAAVGSAPLGEPSNCSPAFVRGRIYIRGEKHLFCIGEEQETSG